MIISSVKKIKKNKETRAGDGSEVAFEWRINLGTELSRIWEKNLSVEEVALVGFLFGILVK